MNFISDDKKVITLPIPLESIVYTFSTTCNDACTFQKDEFDKIFPPEKNGRCHSDMPCHIKLFSIGPVVFDLFNLGYILDNWNIKYFETKEQAREAGEKLVKLHLEQLLELGLKDKVQGEYYD